MLTPINREYHFKSAKNFQPGRRKFSLSKKQFILFLISSLLIFLLILAVWHFVLNRFRNFTGEGVSLDVNLPENIVNGEIFDLEVVYSNQERVSLKDAKLTVQYPKGFVFLDSSLKSEDNGKTIKIGKVERFKNSRIKIQGKLFGEIGKEENFKFVFFYQPDNFNSYFQKEKETKIKIGEADLGFEIEAPEKVKKDEEITITIKYSNSTNKDLEDFYLEFTSPAGFEIFSILPEPSIKDKKIWEIARFKAGQDELIKITGRFTSDTEKEKIFKANLGVRDQFKQFYPQITREAKIEIVKMEVLLIYTANNEQKLNVRPGDFIKFNIKYKNIGNVTIKNGVIETFMDAKYFTAESIDIGMNGAYSNGKIKWDEKADQALLELKPGDGGDLRFEASFLPESIFKEKGLNNFILSSKASIHSENVKDLNLLKFNQNSNELALRLIAGLEIINEARYYDMNFESVGSGPFPPKVGEKTVYQIGWVVINNLGVLDNVRVVGKLPDTAKVNFEGNSTTSKGGDIVFNSEKREIVWEVGNIAEDTEGIFAYFNLSLLPEPSDLGKTVILMPDTIVSGRDAVTGEDMFKQGAVLDTDLETDF